MPPVSQQSLAPFASLSSAPVRAPRQRGRLVQLFLAPFRDVDDRVARKAAASKREREERLASMSGAAGLRR